ncbi:dTMP kinase [Actinosynnema pretiosum]|uniref:dTMP kinase n=1 Tax=Actinosynnema pretiosum TaxID=42197 RepID=UPI000ABE81DD|nr:hypothetical protein [Actinosynnema pretiosum]
MLIVFEGLHSSGKSTQAGLLAEWLVARGVVPTRTSWNSSTPLGATITDLKIRDRLGPQALVLMEAADLAHRWESGLGEVLAAGGVVISDRYHYSTMARGVIRGISLEHIRECFRFAPEPDLVLHVRCTGRETLRRRLAAGQSLGSHLCGADYRPVVDERAAFVEHQDRMAELYGELLPEGTVDLPLGASREEAHALVLDAYRAAGGPT